MITISDTQKQTAEAMVNVFETGRVRGRYGAVTVLKGDSGHLSYGRSQAALGSGTLYLLLKDYCETPNARFAGQFIPLLPRFRNKDTSLDFDRGVRDLLEDAGDDPAMQRAQDEFFDRSYWQPALRACEKCGLTLPLAAAVVYDSHIHGGFSRIRDRVPGGPAVSPAVDEQAWITRYLQERKRWLLAGAPPLPNTVYRVNEFLKLVDEKRWDLRLPFTARGVVIDSSVLQITDETAVSARVPDEETTRPILQLTRPYTRGEDVKALQVALQARGFSGDTDGVFGPMTDVLVKQFQRKANLKDDGVVGPSTWSELSSRAASAAA